MLNPKELVIDDPVKALRRLLKKIAMIVQAESVAILTWPDNEVERDNLCFVPDLSLDIKGATPNPSLVGAGGTVERLFDQTLDSIIAIDPGSFFESANSDNREFICAKVQMQERNEDERITGTFKVGVIYVFRKRYKQMFTDDDTRLLEMLADQAGAVLYNGRKLISLAQENTDLKRQLQERDREVERLQGIIDAADISRPG